MSATNSTTNYNLPQFIATDKPAWLTDFNGAMADIDTAIKAAKNAGDNAQTSANTNASNISTLDGTVGGHTTAIGTLQTTVAGNTGSINTINSLIGNGEPTTTDKTIIGAINELNTFVSAPEAKDVEYSNTTSGLTATNVQSAIDEVVTMIPSGGSVDADDVSYSNTSSGLTATNVQDAIDELATSTSDIDLNFIHSGTCTITAGSDVTLSSGEYTKVSYLANSDYSIGKIYGVLRASFSSVQANTWRTVATFSGMSFPTIDTEYNIAAGFGIASSGSNPARLVFKTNGNIELQSYDNGSTTFDFVLPACLYILKDLGD